MGEQRDRARGGDRLQTDRWLAHISISSRLWYSYGPNAVASLYIYHYFLRIPLTTSENGTTDTEGF